MDETEVKYKSLRLNLLASAAYIVVLLILGIVVWMQITDEFAKGILTLVLGRFVGYVDNVYAFEFGTTRGSKEKDVAITNLANAAKPEGDQNATKP